MRLRYDQDFVETAVNLCVSGLRKDVPAIQVRRFLGEREKLYRIVDPDDRDTAFFDLHVAWFREWGLEKLLTNVLEEFPLLPNHLQTLAFRQARGKNDEGAELYVKDGGVRSGVIALRPDRLKSDAGVVALLRHEFMHLQDMIDPRFSYRPDSLIAMPSLSQPRLAIERYRILWDIAIDGRLTEAGHPTLATRDERAAEFNRAFHFWHEDRRSRTFDLLWTSPAPTHEMLARLVTDPRDLRSASGPTPGAPCPLCGFPTFDWADITTLPLAISSKIGTEFPAWLPAQGLCRRCLEAYESAFCHESLCGSVQQCE